MDDGTAGKQFLTINNLVDANGAWSAANCSNIDCHYNTTVTIADWYNGSLTINCTYCHQTDAAYNAASSPLPNAHTVHVDEVADGGYNYACAVCHPNHGTTYGHEDGVVNLTSSGMPREADADASFTPSATPAVKYGGAGTYTTCGNVYCHGDFDGAAAPAIGGGNAANAPVWNVPAGGDCGTCHGSVAGADAIAKSWPRTGSYTQSHGEHVVSNSAPGCSACHDSDVNGAVAAQGTYGDEALHANGVVNLVFGETKAEAETVNYEALTAAYNDAVGNGAATGAETCANVRCHNGLTAPAFDLAAGVDIVCGDCHGVPATDDPRPAGSAAGLHAGHANADTVYTDCDNCHGDATYSVSNARGGSPYLVTGGGGAAGSGLHQNLVVNLYVATGSGVYTDTVNTSAGVNWNVAGGTHDDNGTCSATVCHNNDNTGAPLGTTRAWNVAYTPADNCLMCHANGADAVADAAGADSVDDQWATRGHGSATGGTLGNNPAGNASSAIGGCDFCHLADVWQEHMPAKQGTNPYRLRTAPTANTVCLACHLTADAGFDAPGGSANAVNSTLNVDQTHNGAKHQALEGGQFCWDCHEAHGGSATNILMVKDYMSIAADAYGVPTTTTTTALTSFTARAAATDFVDTTGPTEATSGICQKCHVNKAVPDVKYWRNDGTEDVNQDNTNDAGINDTNRHNQAQACTNCHLHTNRFEASCTDCHGTTASNYYPDGGAQNGGRGAEPGGQARGAHRADRGGDGRLVQYGEREHVRLVPPERGALGGRGQRDAGAVGAAPGGRGDALPDDQRAGGHGRRVDGGGELQQRELPLQHDGDDRGLVQRGRCR